MQCNIYFVNPPIYSSAIEYGNLFNLRSVMNKFNRIKLDYIHKQKPK